MPALHTAPDAREAADPTSTHASIAYPDGHRDAAMPPMLANQPDPQLVMPGCSLHTPTDIATPRSHNATTSQHQQHPQFNLIGVSPCSAGQPAEASAACFLIPCFLGPRC